MSFQPDARRILRVSAWAEWDWLDHGFGTKESGQWTPPHQTATLKQIHSDIVVRVNGHRGQIGEGDGLITNEQGVHLTIRTADCVPILLVDPVRRVVGAVHAGWRGTAASIALRAVERMRVEFGCNAGEIRAAIGPCIQQCCYEVGAEVASRFLPWFPELAEVTGPVKIDLVEANRRQLAQAGLSQIESAGACTLCVPDGFHSFRRDKDLSGRMVTGIAILAS